MKVIVTRPEEDAEVLASALRSLGHDPILAPLLVIRSIEGAVIPDLRYQAVLFTSANGVKALGERASTLSGIPAFVVGPASGRAAAQAGFGDVSIAGGDVAALERLVRERVHPGGGPLLHVSGEQVAGDLSGGLAAAGFTVERAVLYRAEPAADLPEAAASAVGPGTGVALYSPRTARIWVELVGRGGLAERARAVIHFCLSGNVDKVLRDSLGNDVRTMVAGSPDEESMLAAIGPAN